MKCAYCENDHDTIVMEKGKAMPLCEVCYDGWIEWQAELNDPYDPHGYRDPSPEEQAGWAMQDKIDMYRREH